MNKTAQQSADWFNANSFFNVKAGEIRRERSSIGTRVHKVTPVIYVNRAGIATVGRAAA